MNFARYEQEVVINLNADEEMATVYSDNHARIRKMDALVKEFPDVFRIKRWTEVSKTYEVYTHRQTKGILDVRTLS